MTDGTGKGKWAYGILSLSFVGYLMTIIFAFTHTKHKWVPVICAWQSVALAYQGWVFLRREHTRRFLKIATNVTAIVSTWSLNVASTAYVTHGLFGVSATLFAASQFLALWRLSTMNLQRYKVLTSFSQSTVNLVGTVNLVALVFGFIQGVVDAHETGVDYRLWVGPLSSILSSIFGVVPTSLLMWSIHRQRHGLLKLSRHLLIVALGYTVSAAVLTPVYFLAALTWCALLALSRNVSDGGRDYDSPPRAFWDAIRRDLPNYLVLISAAFGLFFRLLPYHSDYGRIYSAAGESHCISVFFVTMISFSWLFEVLALSMLTVAVGNQRRDLLMIARSFITLAAAVSPFGTWFEIKSALEDHTISTGANVFRGMGAVVLTLCCFAMIFTSRSRYVPPSPSAGGLIGPRDDGGMDYVGGRGDMQDGLIAPGVEDDDVDISLNARAGNTTSAETAIGDKKTLAPGEIDSSFSESLVASAAPEPEIAAASADDDAEEGSDDS